MGADEDGQAYAHAAHLVGRRNRDNCYRSRFFFFLSRLPHFPWAPLAQLHTAYIPICSNMWHEACHFSLAPCHGRPWANAVCHCCLKASRLVHVSSRQTGRRQGRAGQDGATTHGLCVCLHALILESVRFAYGTHMATSYRYPHPLAPPSACLACKPSPLRPQVHSQTCYLPNHIHTGCLIFAVAMSEFHVCEPCPPRCMHTYLPMDATKRALAEQTNPGHRHRLVLGSRFEGPWGAQAHGSISCTPRHDYLLA
jgi:hypothetical protein